MAEIKKQSEPRDYKERFEFVLTVGDNIICQRYFRINNFNPASLRSFELTETIRDCVSVIDRDLKDKTYTYLKMYAPISFDSEEQMYAYFEKHPEYAKEMHIGEGLVVRDNMETDYFWTGDSNAPIKELGYKFDDGELTGVNCDDNKTTYKFAFKVDGRESCSIQWDGYYPKFVRDKIDLSNKRGKFEDGEIDRLSFEQYLLYKMVEGKNDLVYGLIKNICYACSYADSKNYTANKNEIMEGWNRISERALWHLN